MFPPFNLFDILPQNRCWKTRKGPVGTQRANSVQFLGLSGTVKEYLTLWSLFAIFEPILLQIVLKRK